MRITDYLVKNAINLDLVSTDKEKVLKELFSGLSESENIIDKEKCFEDIIKREKMGSTGVGYGVAIPHAKTDAVDKIIMTIGISKNGVEYKSIDDSKCKIFFMFLTPTNLSQEYLILLAKISRFIKEDGFRKKILDVNTVDDLICIIDQKEG